MSESHIVPVFTYLFIFLLLLDISYYCFNKLFSQIHVFFLLQTSTVFFLQYGSFSGTTQHAACPKMAAAEVQLMRYDLDVPTCIMHRHIVMVLNKHLVLLLHTSLSKLQESEIYKL